MHDPIGLTAGLILPGLLGEIKKGIRNNQETKAAAILTYIQAKLSSCFPNGEEEMQRRQSEPLCRKECPPSPQKPQGQEVKLAKQNLKIDSSLSH